MNVFIWLDILLHIYARWHTDDSEKYKKKKKKRFVCCHSVDTAGVLFKRNAGCDRVFTRGYAEKKKKMWQLATKSWSSTKYCMFASSWKFRLKEKKTQHALSQLGGAMGLPHTRRSHSLHEWRRSWMTLLGEMFGEKKSCRYESKDIFWFDSHLFGAAIKGWFTPTDTRSYNFTDKRVNCDNYMWPSCNYSPPERRSQGGRRLGYSGGETPVWQVTFWGWEITSPARCSLTPNICLLLFSHGDLEGCFFFRVEFKWKHMWSPDQVWRAATSGPLHLSLSHNCTTQTGLWQLIWTPPDPSRTTSVSHKAEGKKKIQSRPDWQLPHRLMCSGGFTRQGQTETGVFKRIKSSPSEEKKSGYLQLWWERFFNKGIFVMGLSLTRSIAH